MTFILFFIEGDVITFEQAMVAKDAPLWNGEIKNKIDFKLALNN